MSEVKVNKLNTRTNTALTIQQNSTTAMTIDTSQNVGIGTTSPSSTLDVNGTLTANGVSVGDNENINLGASNDLQIYHNGTDNYIYSNNKILRIQANGSTIKINPVNADKSAEFNANGSVDLYYDNSKKFETTSTGVTVSGDLRIGGTGTANALDDYEEGTWTPAVGGTNADPSGITYNTQIGTYKKIGNLVTVFVSITINSKGTSGAGAIVIRNLPFTRSSTSDHYPTSGGMFAGLLTNMPTTTIATFQTNPNNTNIFVTQSSGTTSNPDTIDFATYIDNGTIIRTELSYETA